MKLKLSLIVLIFNYFFTIGQNNQDVSNSIFIFTRSTDMKVSYIAHDFNTSDTLSTHVGIGFKINNEYQIFNVSNDIKSSSKALRSESLETFLKVQGIKYHSVWEYEIPSDTKDKFIKVLSEYDNRQITFDYDFEIKNDSKLYCSEFVFLVLKKLHLTRSYKGKKKELNNFYRNLLKRNTLEYIPVDFFLDLHYFKLIENKFY